VLCWLLVAYLQIFCFPPSSPPPPPPHLRINWLLANFLCVCKSAQMRDRTIVRYTERYHFYRWDCVSSSFVKYAHCAVFCLITVHTFDRLPVSVSDCASADGNNQIGLVSRRAGLVSF
jgi:hypothetical protein